MLRRFIIAAWLLFLGPVSKADSVAVFGNDTQLIFGGSWLFLGDASRCAGYGYVASSAQNSTTTLLFKGIAASVYLLKLENGALATVYVDGVKVSSNLDLVDAQQFWWYCTVNSVTSPQLPNGSHNITIMHSGRSSDANASLPDSWLAMHKIVYYTDYYNSLQPSLSSTATGSTSSAQSTRSTSGIKLGALIGGLIGTLLGGMLLGLAAGLYIRKRQREAYSDAYATNAVVGPQEQAVVPWYSSLSAPFSHSPPAWNAYNPSQEIASAPDSSPADRPTSMVSAAYLNHHGLPSPPVPTTALEPGPGDRLSSPPPQYDKGSIHGQH